MKIKTPQLWLGIGTANIVLLLVNVLFIHSQRLIMLLQMICILFSFTIAATMYQRQKRTKQFMLSSFLIKVLLAFVWFICVTYIGFVRLFQ